MSTPYNPWKNGFVERKNRTMLHDEDIPMHLWLEVAIIAMYVHNRTPHRVLDNKTPAEDFSGEKPEFIPVRTFAFSVYIQEQKNSAVG